MKGRIDTIFGSGLGWMLLSALVFSLADLLTKYLSGFFAPSQIAFVRFLFGVTVLWPILSSKGISLRGNQTHILVLRGIFGTLSFFCLLKAMVMTSLPEAIVLLYTFPLFAFLFSSILLKTEIEIIEVILIALGLAGIYIFISPDFRSFNMGYLFGLLSGCLGGLAMVLIHKARETNGPLIIYFYFCLIGGILTFPFWIRGFRVPEVRSGILLVLLALLLLVGQILMNQGFKYCQAAQGSLILMSEVVFAGVAGLFLFRDPLTSRFVAGGLLIVGSGVGLNFASRFSRPFSNGAG